MLRVVVLVLLLVQGADVKEAAAAAQAAAAAAAEAHVNIQALWKEVGQLRGRQGQMDRRLDDVWQVKVRCMGQRVYVQLWQHVINFHDR